MERFSDFAVVASRLLYLVPSVIIRDDFTMTKLDNVINYCENVWEHAKLAKLNVSECIFEIS